MMKHTFKRRSVILLLLFIGVFFAGQKQAMAICIPCLLPFNCDSQDCSDAKDTIAEINDEGMENLFLENEHEDSRDTGPSYNDQFDEFEDWLFEFSREQIIPALQRMTTQLGAVAMHQVFTFGTFLDAKTQLNTQRLFQKLRMDAHRDYQPSQDFCQFGTAVRSLSATEARSRYQSRALNARQMARQLGNISQSSASSKDSDKFARWEQFTEHYCDSRDNYWNENSTQRSGLIFACSGDGGGDANRINADINFTRTIDNPRTLVINFTETPDREDVFALGSNIYGHDVLSRDFKFEDQQADSDKIKWYMALRSVAARRNVAENSYNAIVELKTAGTSDLPHGEQSRTREFLAAILTEMGVADDDVYSYIGERPSYYAQLEILAKKIYQNPDFYVNLYDKPANVERKSVALRAIELMLDRAIYESQLRREMATSVLLATELYEKIEDIDEKTVSGGS